MLKVNTIAKENYFGTMFSFYVCSTVDVLRICALYSCYAPDLFSFHCFRYKNKSVNRHKKGSL